MAETHVAGQAWFCIVLICSHYLFSVLAFDDISGVARVYYCTCVVFSVSLGLTIRSHLGNLWLLWCSVDVAQNDLGMIVVRLFVQWSNLRKHV